MQPSDDSEPAVALWRKLAECCKRARLLSAIRPLNWQEERTRIFRLAERKQYVSPKWAYFAPSDELRGLIRESEDLVARANEVDAVDLSARAHELLVETKLAVSPGTPAFAALARQRFVVNAPWLAARKAIHHVRNQWIAERFEFDELRGQGREPSVPWYGSARVVGAAAAVFAELEVSFEVELSRAITARAATSDDCVYVRDGLQLRGPEVEQIVVHEVFGHALPRASARGDARRMVGPAFARDTQEGFALLLEELSGKQDASRRYELAVRDWACEMMMSGALFPETLEALVDADTPLELALTACLRIYRGGSAQSAGLGREYVYLPAYLWAKEQYAANGMTFIHACRQGLLAPSSLGNAIARIGLQPSPADERIAKIYEVLIMQGATSKGMPLA
jgi:hypothetical protein